MLGPFFIQKGRRERRKKEEGMMRGMVVVEGWSSVVWGKRETILSTENGNFLKKNEGKKELRKK